MCSSRLLQTLGRSPKSPRMFLSLTQCHNPLANSERPKNQKQTAPRVFTARGAICFKANKLRTMLAGHVNTGIDTGRYKNRGVNLREGIVHRHSPLTVAASVSADRLWSD